MAVAEVRGDRAAERLLWGMRMLVTTVMENVSARVNDWVWFVGLRALRANARALGTAVFLLESRSRRFRWRILVQPSPISSVGSLALDFPCAVDDFLRDVFVDRNLDLNSDLIDDLQRIVFHSRC